MVALRSTHEENPDDGENDEEAKAENTATTSSDKTERPLVPGKGITDTRWVGRASTLHRFSKRHVLKATSDTMKDVMKNSIDGNARAVASGYLTTIRSPSFLLLQTAFKKVLSAVNTVSEYLQKKCIDIGAAMQEIAMLKTESRRLRSDTHWKASIEEAETPAATIDVNLRAAIVEKDETTRERKKPRRIDGNPASQVRLKYTDTMKMQHFYPAMDKIISKLDERFPLFLGDFKYLQPANFDSTGAEAIRSLAQRHSLDCDRTATQWRLFSHVEEVRSKTALVDICSTVPERYSELRRLYQIC